jgi:UDP-N-acetylglucosamine 1-carboxyvinyltransferase
MSKYFIQGSFPLRGEVTIQGAKNAAQKILPATIVFPGTYVLNNLPRIQDTAALIEILRFLGAEVTFVAPHRVRVNTERVVTKEIPPEITALSTGTFLFAGALLSRYGEVKLWHPGGDRIGKRPVTWHLDAFRQLGASVHEADAYYHVRATKLVGTTIPFLRPTANGAVNAVIAAARAAGETTIENVAPEPEIRNVVAFLQTVGAQIEWRDTHSLHVRGVDQGTGSGETDIIPDRNDAATFLIAGVLGHGPVTLQDVSADHLTPLLDALTSVGARLEIRTDHGPQSITVQCATLNPSGLDITSRPYPGFSTDWGPLIQVLMTQLSATGTFHETIFSQRFAHITELVKMGATIQYLDLPADEGLYNFTPTPEADGYHAIQIRGPSQLHGTAVQANDVRAGAALVLSGLIASGVTEVTGVEQVARGYEAFAERLNQLGAAIQQGP